MNSGINRHFKNRKTPHGVYREKRLKNIVRGPFFG
jgi:hypothetical protein